MLHQVAQPFEQALVNAALVDLGVIDRLQQHAQHHVFVARVVLHGALGIAHGADLLALDAAGTDLDGREQADELFLVRQAAGMDVVDQAVEGKGEGPHRQLAVHQLGRVHDVAGVHALLEGAQGIHLVLAEKGDLGNADAVFARDLAAHVGVIGVDRDVHVAVAVARVHVAGNHNAAGLHVGPDFGDLFGQVGIFFRQLVQKGFGPRGHFNVRDVRGRHVAGRGLGSLGELAVEVLVLHGEAGQAAHFLQGVAVGRGRALQVELL